MKLLTTVFEHNRRSAGIIYTALYLKNGKNVKFKK